MRRREWSHRKMRSGDFLSSLTLDGGRWMASKSKKSSALRHARERIYRNLLKR